MRFVLLGFVLACLVLLESKRRVRLYYRGPFYVQQIQAWQPDRLIELPPIQPLKARKS
jgi:hypothetical protein